MGETSDPLNQPGERRAAMSGRGIPDTGDDMIGDDMIATRHVGETASRPFGDEGRSAAAATTGSEPTTEAIRGDIEHTRKKMSGTIDEIQERLSPTRLVNEAKETVREATVGKVTGMMNSASDSAQGIVERIKENPMSAAMIGIGAWWLLGKLPGNSGRSSSSYRPSIRELWELHRRCGAGPPRVARLVAARWRRPRNR